MRTATLGDVPLDPRRAGHRRRRRDGASAGHRRARGLLRFHAADAVPEDGRAGAVHVITPMLNSPDREDGRRWLRVEATVDLAGGKHAGDLVCGDRRPGHPRSAERIAADESMTAASALAALLDEPDVWRPRRRFTAAPRPPTDARAVGREAVRRHRAIPVGVAHPSRRAPARACRVSPTLEVLYPGRTLMEHLPAHLSARGSTVRTASCARWSACSRPPPRGSTRASARWASHLHPATAHGPWLDFIARWLGVPWDDALERRAEAPHPATRAADSREARGTRAGLEALLDVPDARRRRRRFRVTDATADFGFATSAAATAPAARCPRCSAGARAGAPSSARGAVLGVMRLPCPGRNGRRRVAAGGRIRVDVAATAAERRGVGAVARAR